MTLLNGDAGANAHDDGLAIRAVDEMFDAAIRTGASDLHIEPTKGGGRIRQRVDGVLREPQSISNELLTRVLSRIKLLAGMDIADRRMPQDGRYTFSRPGGERDARVSSIPTVDGEKLAIRLLDTRARFTALESLGMLGGMATRFRRCVRAATGFVIVCGPTGCGKTTTFYAALAERNAAGLQVCSVEDPVETRLDGVAQVQVNVRAGLTFATALRAFLRQDPDAISIGEVRDAETAEVASSAALCGQLVLSTLHSNDSLGAFERLSELGLSHRRIGACVTAVLSQRLLRLLCSVCKRPARAGDAGSWFGLEPEAEVAEPVGCRQCAGVGYAGRRGVFELILVTADLRGAIEMQAPRQALMAAAATAGYQPMAAAAARLILQRDSSVAEAARIFASVAA
ncbi:MAG TPA: GspE/PulE family protein [Candidatus Tumulicola sp.]|nr:GspE/PulE family protein [Candidatus Tumulicola sp.]